MNDKNSQDKKGTVSKSTQPKKKCKKNQEDGTIIHANHMDGFIKAQANNSEEYEELKFIAKEDIRKGTLVFVSPKTLEAFSAKAHKKYDVLFMAQDDIKKGEELEVCGSSVSKPNIFQDKAKELKKKPTLNVIGSDTKDLDKQTNGKCTKIKPEPKSESDFIQNLDKLNEIVLTNDLQNLDKDQKEILFSEPFNIYEYDKENKKYNKVPRTAHYIDDDGKEFIIKEDDKGVITKEEYHPASFQSLFRKITDGIPISRTKTIKDLIDSITKSKPREKIVKRKRVMSDVIALKYKTFVKEFIIDFNSTRAYRAVYGNEISNESAGNSASRLLGDVRIQKYLQKAVQSKFDKLDISSDDVLKKMQQIAFADLGDFIDWGKYTSEELGDDPDIVSWHKNPSYIRLKHKEDLTKAQTSLISEMSDGKYGLKIKLADRVKALEMLGKYYNLLTDKIEHRGNVNLTFKDFIVDVDDPEENEDGNPSDRVPLDTPDPEPLKKHEDEV